MLYKIVYGTSNKNRLKQNKKKKHCYKCFDPKQTEK